MNSKQRRQRQRHLKRIVGNIIDVVEEMLKEIVDGEKTAEYHLEKCKDFKREMQEAI